MPKLITLEDIDALATGSAFLGTGGGGDPYIGSLLAKQAIRQYGPVTLLAPDEVPDDANVFIAAGMGAPTVMIEKLMSLEDADRAVRGLERYLGRTATAIISAEMGGLNSVVPVAYAAMRGLPIIDADGMGRAFPSLDMVSFNVYGVSCTPMTLMDEHGQLVILETRNARAAEEMARPVVAQMGAQAMMCCYPMTGAQARQTAVPGTLSAALAIGKAILEGDGAVSPVDRLVAALRAQPYYRHAHRLFDGKIVDLDRLTTRGWVFGTCVIDALDGAGQVTIEFQNEHLVARRDGQLLAIVPDLIAVVDRETARPIPTEGLRYGQRVAVIACSAPPILRTPEALAHMGPANFQLKDDFVPIEQLAGA